MYCPSDLYQRTRGFLLGTEYNETGEIRERKTFEDYMKFEVFCYESQQTNLSLAYNCYNVFNKEGYLGS